MQHAGNYITSQSPHKLRHTVRPAFVYLQWETLSP